MKRSSTGRQPMLTGAAILMGAMLAVKAFGALFRIPLSSDALLGDGGMFYFSAAYDIFKPVYALAVSGLPVGVSRLVAQNMAQGRYKDVGRTRTVSSLLFLGAGGIGSVAMLLAAQPYAALLESPALALSIALLAPAPFFCCVAAALRGYYEGMGNMIPTALCQIVEAVAKLLFGLGLAGLVRWVGLWQFSREGQVFGMAAGSREEALQILLPFCAAAAVLGISLSSAAGAVYLLIRHKRARGGLTPSQLSRAPAPEGRRRTAKRILSVAIPVSLAAATLNLSSLIDGVTVMRCLNRVAEESYPRLLEGMPFLEAFPADQLPRQLYGLYTGKISAVYNLIPALTTALGISALPAVTEGWTKGDLGAVRERAGSILRVCLWLALPCGGGLVAIPGGLLHLIYGSSAADSPLFPLSAQLLAFSAAGGVFLAISAPLNSIFQALGRSDLPVKLMIGGALLKIAVNCLTVSHPALHILGAPIGNAVCYGFISITGLFVLRRQIGLSLLPILWKPLLGGLGCGGGAFLSCYLAEYFLRPSLAALAGIAGGGGVFLLILLLTGQLRELFPPKGDAPHSGGKALKMPVFSGVFREKRKENRKKT
ncbi:MAG: polysaccharide biosynthesis C-terminal domain-containing protein [Oscillospiraceae bacterium]|nr:polysaccharide biosynthesis C-terminal domain-containing protein [Oscillospiraceae bacterium]